MMRFSYLVFVINRAPKCHSVEHVGGALASTTGQPQPARIIVKRVRTPPHGRRGVVGVVMVYENITVRTMVVIGATKENMAFGSKTP
jgi:hypothetical protein